MSTLILLILVTFFTSMNCGADTFRWKGTDCQKVTENGDFIQGNFIHEMCTNTVGHTYRWKGTDCQKVTADGDFIGGNFIHEMCTKTVGHTYRWEGTDCQKVTADGDFIGGNFIHEMCTKTVGHTYRWKGRDCQQVSAEGNFIRSNFGDEFCNETKDFFDSLNSCAKKIPNVTLVFGKNEILKETARLLNEACNSNEVSDFPKCYASYHFIELKKSRILGATERESVEFCRKTENNLGVANCFNKLKALDFSTESSFKYCSQNYSPEFVSCAQSLTKYKNVNLLKPKDEVLSVCHSRPLTQDQLNCFGSLTKKLVDPENAFEVCSYSKDSKYSGCLISNISVKSDFSKGKQICQAAAQSSSYIGLESLSEDLNKLAKVSYPGLAKIYRKQAEYLAKYKFNTGNWNAENDIFAFTVLSLSPFIEYNTASYYKTEVIPSYLNAKKIVMVQGYASLSSIHKSKELVRFALQSLAMGLQAIRLTLSEPVEIKHCEQTLVLIGNALASLDPSGVREVTLQVDKIVKINPLQTQPLGIFTSSINEFLKN